jgi:DNA repair protein RadC
MTLSEPLPDLFGDAGLSDAAARAFDHSGSAFDDLRDRAHRIGVTHLTGQETLELYLSRSLKRGARTVAQALLSRFGTIHAVLAADQHQLERYTDRATAIDLKLLFDITRRTMEAEVVHRVVTTSWSQVLAYLRFRLQDRTREMVGCLFLDKKNRIIVDEELHEGTLDHAPVYPREVIRKALEHGACALVLYHPHPSGNPAPSQADIDMTRKVIEAGKPLGIVVHDHIVVGDTCASMKALGLI